jgi:hypothetical protein
MTEQSIRELSILLLDDENGINKEAYDKLHTALMDNGCEDIIAEVEAADGRFFIGERFAEEALANINKWESTTDASE